MTETPDSSPSSALASFAIVAGPRNGEAIPVLAPVVTIGQGPQNDLVLTDDSVSRTHARLEYQVGSWLLTDLESTNGTSVEGVRLAPGVPTPLADAATVRFGGVRLQFHEAPEADPSAARASFREEASSSTVPRRHFRLPLWLFLLILVLVAIAIFLLVSGLPSGTSPSIPATGMQEMILEAVATAPPIPAPIS